MEITYEIANTISDCKFDFFTIATTSTDLHHNYDEERELAFIDGDLVHVYPIRIGRRVQFLSLGDQSFELQQGLLLRGGFSHNFAVDFQQRFICFSRDQDRDCYFYKIFHRCNYSRQIPNLSLPRASLTNGLFSFSDIESQKVHIPISISEGTGKIYIFAYDLREDYFSSSYRERLPNTFNVNFIYSRRFLYDPINEYIITDDCEGISCFDPNGTRQIKIGTMLGYSNEVKHLRRQNSGPGESLRIYDYCLLNRNRLLIATDLGLLVYNLREKSLSITKKTPILKKVAFDRTNGFIAGFLDNSIIIIPPDSWISTFPYWTVNNHFEFDSDIMRIVETFTMIRTICSGNSLLNVISLLPNELLFEIFGYLRSAL